jgi:Helix-turn-helix
MGIIVGVSQHDMPWFWLRGSAGVRNAMIGVRRVAGLTQAQLAQQLGIDRTTLIKMEAGKNEAIGHFIAAFNRPGYDLIAVPRGAHVSVTPGSDEVAHASGS